MSRSMVSGHLEAGVLLVARDVPELGERLELLRATFGRPDGQLLRVRVLERVLVLRLAHAAVDLQILHRLQVERRSPRPSPSFGASRAMISSALDVRARSAASGSIVRRPLLVVGFVPSEPMNEATHATSGSLRMTSAILCWSSIIRGNETSGDASRRREEPRVLLREEALRDEEREEDGEPERGDRHEQGRRTGAAAQLRPHVVEANHRLEAALGELVELAPLLLWRLGLEEVRAHHRRERERQDGRHADGDAERDGELAEEAADEPPHEEQRDEDGDERDRERDDGEADLRGPLQRRVERLLPLLDVAAMFSIMTMASSTTKPVEIVSAISDRLFRL